MKRKIKIILMVIAAMFMFAVTFENCALGRIAAKKGVKAAFYKKIIKPIGKEGKMLSKVFADTKIYRAFRCNSLKEAFEKLTLASRNIHTPIKQETVLKCIKNSALYKELQAIESKGVIKLNEKEMRNLLANPTDNFRGIIKAKTDDSKKFQEFFIRLANGDKNQLKTLLSNDKIREMVESRIRSSSGGSNHEWFMCKNYLDFLTNPKWGKDGNYLSLAMTKLVQKTEGVIFKYGGGHGATNSAIFHNGLAKVIEKCNTKEQLLVEIKKYAKKELSDNSYTEFNLILKDLFKKA